MGETQWNWLEAELRKQADLRIIGSSTQILTDYGEGESWSDMPHERKRFLKLLEKTAAEGVVIISGDRHFGELALLKSGVPYPLYELTSSGLTMSASYIGNSELRLLEPVLEINYGLLEINWDKKEVKLGIKNLNGKRVVGDVVSLEELK